MFIIHRVIWLLIFIVQLQLFILMLPPSFLSIDVVTNPSIFYLYLSSFSISHTPSFSLSFSLYLYLCVCVCSRVIQRCWTSSLKTLHLTVSVPLRNQYLFSSFFSLLFLPGGQKVLLIACSSLS